MLVDPLADLLRLELLRLGQILTGAECLLPTAEHDGPDGLVVSELGEKRRETLAHVAGQRVAAARPVQGDDADVFLAPDLDLGCSHGDLLAGMAGAGETRLPIVACPAAGTGGAGRRDALAVAPVFRGVSRCPRRTAATIWAKASPSE